MYFEGLHQGAFGLVGGLPDAFKYLSSTHIRLHIYHKSLAFCQGETFFSYLGLLSR